MKNKHRNTASSANADIEALLGYLGITYEEFTSHEVTYFAELRRLLLLNNAIPERVTVDRNSFRRLLRKLQKDHGLTENGLPGEDTLWLLQTTVIQQRRVHLSKLHADVWIRPERRGYKANRDGYDSFWLRADAANRFRQLQQEVHEYGGIVTSSGAMRALQAPVTTGRSSTSLHYAGLAFDLALPTGMKDPGIDPYIITQDSGMWRVWARAAGGEKRKLEAVVWTPDGTGITSMTDTVVDFTGLAAKYGFRSIPPRESFPEEYIGAEWWHFQCEALLKPWLSQFGIELLAIVGYSLNDLRSARNIWEQRKRIYRRQHRDGGW